MKLLTKELLARLETVSLRSSRRIRSPQRGERPGLRKGSSLEFSDYREYLQGDDIRSIDWNVYARTEKLFLKLFLEEESKPVYFVIDCSLSMSFGEPSKLDYASALAASLGYASLRKYDRPHFLLLHGKNFLRIPVPSMQSFFPLLKKMESRTVPAGETHLNAAIRRIALARLPKGIYLLLSDFCSPDGFDAIKLLAAAGNEIHCLQFLTPEEINPPVRGDLRLIDSETGDPADVSITPRVLRDYRKRMGSFQGEVRNVAHQSMSSFCVVETSLPLPDAIFGQLRRQGILV